LSESPDQVPASLKVFIPLAPGGGQGPPDGPPPPVAAPAPTPEDDDEGRFYLDFDPANVHTATETALTELARRKHEHGLCFDGRQFVRIEAVGADFRAKPINSSILRAVLGRLIRCRRDGKDCAVPQALLVDLLAQPPTALAAAALDAATVILGLKSLPLIAGIVAFARAKALNRPCTVNPVYHEFGMSGLYVWLDAWLKRERIKRPANWPRSSIALGRRAKGLVPLLDELGVELVGEVVHKERGNFWLIAAFAALAAPDEGSTLPAIADPSVASPEALPAKAEDEGTIEEGDLFEATGFNNIERQRQQEEAE
jgi:hypothetical protein